MLKETDNFDLMWEIGSINPLIFSKQLIVQKLVYDK
jgi:hypothetical protein